MRQDGLSRTRHPLFVVGLFQGAQVRRVDGAAFQTRGKLCLDQRRIRIHAAGGESWPTSCTKSSSMDNGAYLYYDLKPEQYGRMSIALYTDTSCVVEYEGDTSIEDVLALMGYDDDDRNENGDATGDIYTLEEDVAQWNDAFDVYKQCQPCKAYDLVSIVNTDYNRSTYEHRNRDLSDGERNRDLSGDDDEEFVCHDDAGYNDVNQVSIVCKGNDRIWINKI
jgi:hypothetical protein